jgi:hypothetical protein
MDAYLLVGIPNNFVEDDNMHNVCIYIYILSRLIYYLLGTMFT